MSDGRKMGAGTSDAQPGVVEARCAFCLRTKGQAEIIVVPGSHDMVNGICEKCIEVCAEIREVNRAPRTETARAACDCAADEHGGTHAEGCPMDPDLPANWLLDETLRANVSNFATCKPDYERNACLVRELSRELLWLRSVIRTGGAMYRAERAKMGIPGGIDPDDALGARRPTAKAPGTSTVTAHEIARMAHRFFADPMNAWPSGDEMSALRRLLIHYVAKAATEPVGPRETLSLIAPIVAWAEEFGLEVSATAWNALRARLDEQRRESAPDDTGIRIDEAHAAQAKEEQDKAIQEAYEEGLFVGTKERDELRDRETYLTGLLQRARMLMSVENVGPTLCADITSAIGVPLDCASPRTWIDGDTSVLVKDPPDDEHPGLRRDARVVWPSADSSSAATDDEHASDFLAGFGIVYEDSGREGYDLTHSDVVKLIAETRADERATRRKTLFEVDGLLASADVCWGLPAARERVRAARDVVINALAAWKRVAKDQPKTGQRT